MLEGFLVEAYRPAQPEWILALRNDPQFGPAIMFGLGGIYVEILRQVSFRLAPLRDEDIEALLDESGRPLRFAGARGEPARQPRAPSVDAMRRLSELALAARRSWRRYPRSKSIRWPSPRTGVLALDALIVLRPEHDPSKSLLLFGFVLWEILHARHQAAGRTRSIAVIGASSQSHQIGRRPVRQSGQGQFQGPALPDQPQRPGDHGLKAYPTLAEVPEKVDLVYIVLPQQHVEDAVKQCVAAGARAACIITAGFSEASDKGRGDEDKLREIASGSGLLLAGPNTIGMVNAEVGMMGSFVNFPRWETGGVSFFTQTGIFTGAVMLHVMTAERSACRWVRASTSAIRSTSTSWTSSISSPTIPAPR